LLKHRTAKARGATKRLARHEGWKLRPLQVKWRVECPETSRDCRAF
jgi:hypothetical protein